MKDIEMFGAGFIFCLGILSMANALHKSDIIKQLKPFSNKIICTMNGEAYVMKHNSIATLIPTRNTHFDKFCTKSQDGMEVELSANILSE